MVLANLPVALNYQGRGAHNTGEISQGKCQGGRLQDYQIFLAGWETDMGNLVLS